MPWATATLRRAGRTGHRDGHRGVGEVAQASDRPVRSLPSSRSAGRDSSVDPSSTRSPSSSVAYTVSAGASARQPSSQVDQRLVARHGGDRQREQRADARPDRARVVEVSAVAGDHHPGGAEGVGGADDRAEVPRARRPVDEHHDAVGRTRDVRQVARGDPRDQEQLGQLLAIGQPGEQRRAELDALGGGEPPRTIRRAHRDGSAPDRRQHRPHRPAGRQAPVDRLHALDEELAALLALAAVVAQRLEQLERGVLALDPASTLVGRASGRGWPARRPRAGPRGTPGGRWRRAPRPAGAPSCPGARRRRTR